MPPILPLSPPPIFRLSYDPAVSTLIGMSYENKKNAHF